MKEKNAVLSELYCESAEYFVEKDKENLLGSNGEAFLLSKTSAQKICDTMLHSSAKKLQLPRLGTHFFLKLIMKKKFPHQASNLLNQGNFFGPHELNEKELKKWKKRVKLKERKLKSSKKRTWNSKR